MIPPRVRDIDLDALDALPHPCRGCMFWPTRSAPQGQAATDPTAQDAWWRAVQLDWGTPGKGIWHGDQLVAFALFAPLSHVQRVRTLPLPVSDDALLLATLWTAPEQRSHGHARHLLQVVAREAIAHGHPALEAYGSAFAAEGGCVLSGEALRGLGFEVHRQHPTGLALYRIDLDRTVSWPAHVGHALGGVIASLQGRERGRVRPALERSPGGQPGL